MWLYLMLAVTLANGIAFAFFGNSVSVRATALHTLTRTAFGTGFTVLWGAVAIGAVVLTVFNLLARYRPISSLGPYSGYLVWLYAALVYLTHGYFLQLISAVVWLCFWAMHHMRLVSYRQNVDAGRERPPE